METYVQFAQVVALLSVSALCVYLIVSLVRWNATIALIQKDVAEVARELKPVLDHLAVVAEKLRSISTKIDDQVNLFKGSVESIRRMADNVEQFEYRIQQQLEEPISKVLSLFGAILQKLVGYVGGRTARGQSD